MSVLRPRYRWIDQVQQDLQALQAADWQQVAQNRVLWRLLVSVAKIHFGSLSQHYWMPTSIPQLSFGFPAQALKAGSDLDGAGIYLGRAHHEGDIVPAKVIPSANACYIAYNGEEIFKDEFELLIPTTSAIAWYPCHSGVVPPGAVEAGVTAEGETLFFGRVAHEGCITPGKIHPSHNACYYPFNGEELVSSEYECLVLHHDGNFMAR